MLVAMVGGRVVKRGGRGRGRAARMCQKGGPTRLGTKGKNYDIAEGEQL